MTSVKIRLSAIDDIRRFVNTVSKYYSLDATLKSDRYMVCAKSLLGIFTLDLMKPIELIIKGENYEPLLNEVSRYIVCEQ